MYCHILLNAWKFQTSFRVWQGYHLSSLLSVLAAEPLVVNTLTNSKILGISLPLGDTVAKVTTYADDTTCYLAMNKLRCPDQGS